MFSNVDVSVFIFCSVVVDLITLSCSSYVINVGYFVFVGFSPIICLSCGHVLSWWSVKSKSLHFVCQLCLCSFLISSLMFLFSLLYCVL